MPLWCPSFVKSSPDYGDEAFVLKRNEDSSLMTMTGEGRSYGGAMNLAYFGRKHFVYLLSVSFRIGTNQITCVQILHIDLIALLNEPLCTYWMQHISGGLVMD